MKRLSFFLFFNSIPIILFSQVISLEEYDLFSNNVYNAILVNESQTDDVSFSTAQHIWKKDKYLAFVPGAVQIRRKWPVVAESIWGGMAISGGIAAYEHFHIINLQHKTENDPSNANWYDEKIRQSKKIRNGSLYALGGIYIANYISALLLRDKDPRTRKLVGFYADPQGTAGLYLALTF